MKRTLIKQGFASRLHDALIANGHFSTRSANGVSIKALSDAIGCSTTMARKYVLAQSLPEPEALNKIALWLKVHPDWLLHGKSHNPDHPAPLSHTQNQALLKFILLETFEAFKNSNDGLNLVKQNIDFILDIYHQAQSLQCASDEKQKIAAWMVSSITHKLHGNPIDDAPLIKEALKS